MCTIRKSPGLVTPPSFPLLFKQGCLVFVVFVGMVNGRLCLIAKQTWSHGYWSIMKIPFEEEKYILFANFGIIFKLKMVWLSARFDANRQSLIDSGETGSFHGYLSNNIKYKVGFCNNMPRRSLVDLSDLSVYLVSHPINRPELFRGF